LKTGFSCSNGADRYEYIDTTPQGDSLGTLIQTELDKQGLPPLRGLAPGILEDAEIALNPLPLLQAALGDTGYCDCIRVEKQVGDMNGSVEGRTCQSTPAAPSGQVRSCAWMIPDYWKDGKGNIYNTPGPGRTPYQARWVKSSDISQEAFNATVKTFNPDGTPINPTVARIDSVRIAGGLEAFDGGNTSKNLGKQLAGVVVFALAAVGIAWLQY